MDLILLGLLYTLLFLVLTGETQPHPVVWLRKLAQAGVAVQLRPIDQYGEQRFELVLNTEALDRQALDLRNADKKIEAIKLVRDALGLDLRESRAYVEALDQTSAT